MLNRPIIEGKYVNEIIEIRYFGTEDDIKNQSNFDAISDITKNNGYIFQVLGDDDPIVADIDDSKFVVVGWVNRTPEFPYDFLLRDLQTAKYIAATLHGRSDGWPLFAIQNDKPTCSRSSMGSDWNCRMCAKYFGTTCKAW